MRPGRAEKKARAKAAKDLIRSLGPAARVMARELEPGDEAIAFLPSGRMLVIRRESPTRFIADDLEDVDAAARVALRWHHEDAQAESVQ